ncbi:MAG: cyclic nucleotide-binding domain-containing protein, partial [Nannocystaceae bacterium]
RKQLLAGYQRGGRALLRGLRAQAQIPALFDRAGDLYWRIFTRIYPSTSHRTQGVRETCSELLRELHERAPLAVARAGIHVAQEHGYTIIEGTEDPWLAVVRAISGGVSPGELRPSRLHVLAERIAFLNRVPLFSSLTSAGLLAIAEACCEIQTKPGEAIFNQGERGDALYVLTSGTVRVVRDRAMINELHRGDCFGEIAIFAETTRTAGVESVDEATCLRLDASSFRQLVRENAEIGLTVISVLGERLRVATEREAALRSLAKTLSE